MTERTTADAASDLFASGGHDLDGQCIFVDLAHVVARAFAENDGVGDEYITDFDDSDPENADLARYYHDGWEAVGALVAAGFIGREDFFYDSTTHSVVALRWCSRRAQRRERRYVRRLRKFLPPPSP